MWRAGLGRKVALLALFTALAVAASYYRAGPAPPDGYTPKARARGDSLPAWLGPGARANVAAHLRGLYGFPIQEDEIEIAECRRAPLSYGQPVVAWFAAEPRGETQRDIFALRGRLSAYGVPLAMREPVNVTRTPEGDEQLLDATEARVLYATRIGGRFQNAVALDFSRSWLPAEASLAARGVAAINAHQVYGTWDGPQRVDVLLSRPPPVLHGKFLTGGRVKLVYGPHDEVEVDLATGSVSDPDRARVLRGAPPQQEVMGLAADTLRRSSLVGPARVMAVESVLFAVTDWMRRQSHRVFPTAADRLPISEAVAPLKTDDAWPPPDVRADRGLPREGRWRVPEPYAGDDAPLRHTFVRVDADRPYERTELFAFDMRRLSLHFVGGTRHPRSTTGARGSGRIPDGARAHLVAAFNGAFKVEHGGFGAVEAGTVLVPPQAGLATVAIDERGQAAFGEWDALRFASPWVDLRQNLRPLVADGEVNPRRVRDWGEVVSSLDESRTPRSAIGLTEDGVMVYAWSGATSARLLGEAMQRAGVHFAMHLDMNPGHTGVELYRGVRGGLVSEPGTDAMDFRRGRWLEVEARDFFYLRRVGGVEGRVALDHPERSEGVWRPVRTDREAPRVGATWISKSRAGSEVRLLLADADRTAARFVPGLAEPRPRTGVPTNDAWLQAAPAAWLDIGLRAPSSRYGLVSDHRTWHAPRVGEMTLAIDDTGAASLGAYGEAVARETDWAHLVQGPALIEDGRATPAAEGRTGMPLAAAARTPRGDLVFASVTDGDRAALAKALALTGARDAVLLGERGTAETGMVRFFRARGTSLLGTDGVTDVFRPVELSLGAGSALVLVPRTPSPRARIVDTFRADPPS